MGDKKASVTHNKGVRQSSKKTQKRGQQQDKSTKGVDRLIQKSIQSADGSLLGDDRLSPAQRQMNAQQLGQTLGNQQISQMLQSEQLARFPDFSSWFTPTQETETQEGEAETETLPTFEQAEFSKEGENFDSTYIPDGPAPDVGTLHITHWVYIDFKPFTNKLKRQEPYRSHQWTPAQLADFNWTPEEQEKFTNDFIMSTSEAWSDKHLLELDESGFSPYKANVNVTFAAISVPDMAHTTINALKVPAGAPRFRSFVSGDRESATLDIRDPSEEETHSVAAERPLLHQIWSFGPNSADITPELEGHLNYINSWLDWFRTQPGTSAQDWRLSIIGYTSSDGNAKYNEQLGKRRAESVQNAITADISWIKDTVVYSFGEESADDIVTESDRMVVVSLRSENDQVVSQNVAAHEAGHMLGLDDEYVDHDANRTWGDTNEDYENIDNLVDSEAAEETLTQDGGSMMSNGSEVMRGHYVYFVQAMNEMTGKTWGVE